MSINKISDLKVGEDYYLCFIKEAKFAKKCRLIGIINENCEHPDNGRTELYLKLLRSTNLVYCEEIGIGETKIEAKNNYGKFKYEQNDNFSNSFKKVSENFHSSQSPEST